ncbi:MAG TPA: hypothetical protein VIC26_07630 [Marinagarivorans sp.]
MQVRMLSRILKATLLTGCVAAAGILGPEHLGRQMDQFWVEEAHQALLTGLVDSRNHAWERQVRVELCPASDAKHCISDVARDGGASGFVGWLSVEVAADGGRKPLKLYRFHSEYVAMNQRGLLRAEQPLGFDAQGYSLQPEVIALQLYSWGGISDKNYIVVVEPSGALQTLVNASLESPHDLTMHPNYLAVNANATEGQL